MDERVITDLHRRFSEIDRRAGKPRLGVVTDAEPLSVALGGADTSYVDVKQIGGHDLKVGDTIVALTFGNDVFVLGRCAGSEPRLPYTFSNGWRNHGGGVAPHGSNGGFYKDAGGTVHLEGVLDKNGGNWIANETVLTLPVGYRPPNTRLFSPPVAPAALSRVDITSAGVVQVIAGGAANPVNYLSLDGISFRAA